MSPITIVIILALIIGGVALGLVLVARRMPKDAEDPIQTRLAEFTERGEQVSLEEIEMSQPFTERVLYPLMRKFGEISSKFTPQKVIQDTTTKLELAGNPGRIDASTFYAGRFVIAAVVGVVAFLLFTFSIKSFLPNSSAYRYNKGRTTFTIISFTLSSPIDLIFTLTFLPKI